MSPFAVYFENYREISLTYLLLGWTVRRRGSIADTSLMLPSPVERLGCGAVSGLLGQAFIYPPDIEDQGGAGAEAEEARLVSWCQDRLCVTVRGPHGQWNRRNTLIQIVDICEIN